MARSAASGLPPFHVSTLWPTDRPKCVHEPAKLEELTRWQAGRPRPPPSFHDDVTARDDRRHCGGSERGGRARARARSHLVELRPPDWPQRCQPL